MHSAADTTTPAWEERLRKITIVIARLGLAYLFLTQLFWKLPPTFGCTNDFAFPVAAPAPNYWDGNGSGGLCYWMGLESIYAPSYRQVLVTDMRPAGLPKIGFNIAPPGPGQRPAPGQCANPEYRLLRLAHLAG